MVSKSTAIASKFLGTLFLLTGAWTLASFLGWFFIEMVEVPRGLVWGLALVGLGLLFVRPHGWNPLFMLEWSMEDAAREHDERKARRETLALESAVQAKKPMG